MADQSVTKGCLGVFFGILAVIAFIVIGIPLILGTGFLWVTRSPATPAPSTVSPVRIALRTPAATTPDPAQAQARAIARYPALGVTGSPLNREFVKRYNQYRKSNPSYFTDPEWPTHLAAECSAP